ncbi:MAG: hypothetical protein GY721_06550 [Deltaproteobacteria bacterium]|nr:hypothetical protein [Deltaproteobacteria bacterium]
MTTYKVIKGTFHVKGYSPDGDSIRFRALNPAHWNYFAWSSQNKKRQTRKQLRLEAIDALETHYQGYHQPGAFALAALEEMLGHLGIENVRYSLSVTKIVNASDGVPGYIASSQLDNFQRPVSFAFPDTDTLVDGEELDSHDLPLKESINYQLAAKGLVYPTFYTGLDREVINELRRVVRSARRRSRGLWAIDRTKGFTMWDTSTIQKDVIIMPKLFRRFVSFFLRRSEMAEFIPYTKKNKDKVIIYSSGDETSLDTLINADGNHYGLTVLPEDMIFKP